MLKNVLALNSKLFAAILLASMQIGCGDGGGTDNILCGGDCPDDPASPLPALTYLDCSELDPGRVYLRGTLQEGSGERDAIIDPADPTRFCLGFVAGVSADGLVSDSGNYIHEQGLTIYSMVQEAFDIETTNNRSTRVYPATPLANDTALLTTTAPSCAIGLIMTHPANDTIYYSCPNNTIHTQDSVPYYSLGNGELLSVLANGSMLVAEFDELKLVDTNLVETPIAPPGPGFSSVRYLTAKSFVDPVTLNPSVWLVVEDDPNPLQRWSIDLTTLVVTIDGDFSAEPANTAAQNFSSKLDGNGSLWQIGVDTTDAFVDIIMTRPLSSSGVPATVVYTESDDDGSEPYFVKIHISNLFTGL